MEKTGIKVGVSACVLGDKVRFDAGHKLSRFVVQDLGAYMDFVSVCPEVGWACLCHARQFVWSRTPSALL